MALLHQDNRSGRGPGPDEKRRSLAEFLGLDTTRLADQPSAAPNLHQDVDNDRDWMWDREPSSPEAAQTPRALVPPNCFPPRHPRAFASFSESARPGTGWGDENSSSSGQGISDLVASLKALAAPPPPPPRGQNYQTSIHFHLSYDGVEKNGGDQWHSDQLNNSAETNGIGREESSPRIPRRASFCGVVSTSRTNCEVPRWSGKLPPRIHDQSAGISAKAFLGGLPWDITEQALMHSLRHFQPVRVEWPEREGGAGGGGGGADASPRGYAFVTFESERRVRALLAACRRDGNNWYYRVQSRKMKAKDAQVIPWSVRDASWVGVGSARLEPARTVFVGALHGMLTARALASIMADLFAGVVYAGIDTDKNKYPIGSGRVTFNNVRSYVRAISAGYAEIHTDKFTKRVQLLPYLEDSMCSVCNLQQGPYFCREPSCYRYFCRSCWQWQHPHEEHAPLMRNSKSAHAHGHAHTSGAGGARHDQHADHAIVYSAGFASNMEGTPSPPMSGSSDVYEPNGSCGDEPDASAATPAWSLR